MTMLKARLSEGDPAAGAGLSDDDVQEMRRMVVAAAAKPMGTPAWWGHDRCVGTPYRRQILRRGSFVGARKGGLPTGKSIRKNYGETMTVIRINRRRPVLLVSRNVDTQDMYIFALRAERIPAVGVSGFYEAVVVARHTDISVVLFDVERPADWDSVSELRRELPAAVPIVVLTGWVRTDGGNRALARRLGCSGFLAKPVPPDVVIDVLQQATGGCPWTEYVSDI